MEVLNNVGSATLNLMAGPGVNNLGPFRKKKPFQRRVQQERVILTGCPFSLRKVLDLLHDFSQDICKERHYQNDLRKESEGKPGISKSRRKTKSIENVWLFWRPFSY